MEKYKPKKEPYTEKRRKLSISADNFYKGREMIINAFKNKIFPMVSTGFSEDDVDEDELFKKRQEENGKLTTIEEELEGEIPDTSTSEHMSRLDKIYAPLIRRYFMENSLTKIMKKFKKYRENPEKLQMYTTLMDRLNIGLERIKNDIKNMSEDKVEEKKHLDYLKNLVRAIVDATKNMTCQT